MKTKRATKEHIKRRIAAAKTDSLSTGYKLLGYDDRMQVGDEFFIPSRDFESPTIGRWSQVKASGIYDGAKARTMLVRRPLVKDKPIVEAAKELQQATDDLKQNLEKKAWHSGHLRTPIIDPGAGYRLLRHDEKIDLHDEVTDGAIWSRTSVSGVTPKQMMGNNPDIKGYRRRVEKQIDPGHGYRLLKAGEIIEKGDEWFREHDSIWIPARSEVGCKLSSERPYYRRNTVGGNDYIVLESGDTIEEGDEYLVGDKWVLSGRVGDKIGDPINLYRRNKTGCGHRTEPAKAPMVCVNVRKGLNRDQHNLALALQALSGALDAYDGTEKSFNLLQQARKEAYIVLARVKGERLCDYAAATK